MKKTCGIYKITNTLNGKSYIGSSNDVFRRFKTHLNQLRSGKHHSCILQRSFNIVGESFFKFEVICFCDLSIKLYLEQQYINCMKPQMNISKSSVAPMEGRRHSENTKIKFRNRPVKKGKESASYGKKWSEETRAKCIKSRTGLKRSQEFKDTISYINKKNNHHRHLLPHIESLKRKIIDCRGNIFQSLMECSEFYNFKVATICDVLKKRSNMLEGKYRLWYYDEFLNLSEDQKYIISKRVRCIVKRKDRFGIRIGDSYHGWYNSPEEACEGYNKTVKELLGYSAILNDMDTVKHYFKETT